MEENLRNILENNAKEYYRNAVQADEKKEYNSAVTLFFKALVALSDLIIFLKEKKIPSNHTERFRILEDKYPEIYQILDKDFSFYQNSYSAKMDKEASNVLRKDVEKLFKFTG